MDLQIKFFIPIWRRIAVVMSCSIWTCLEIWANNFGWGLFAFLITIYCAYQFFFIFQPKDKED